MELPPFTWGTSKASSLSAFADAKRLAARTYEVEADTEQAQTAAAEAGQGKLTLLTMTQCQKFSMVSLDCLSIPCACFCAA